MTDPSVGEFLPQQQPQQRGLAGAAGAREEDELAFLDDERHVAQRVDPAAVHLREVRGFNHGSPATRPSRAPLRGQLEECGEYNMQPAARPAGAGRWRGAQRDRRVEPGARTRRSTADGFARPPLRLDHLADQEPGDGALAGPVLRDLGRMLRERLVDQRLDGHPRAIPAAGRSAPAMTSAAPPVAIMPGQDLLGGRRRHDTRRRPCG